MRQVDMKKEMKTRAEENGEDVIRITFDVTKGYTVATMFTIDKKYDVIFRRVYYSNKGSNKLIRLEAVSGPMVMLKDYANSGKEEVIE